MSLTGSVVPLGSGLAQLHLLIPIIPLLVSSSVSFPQGGVSPQIPFSLPLDPSGYYRLYWSLDYPSSTVNFELHLPDLLFDSWFALGFSDYGQFTSADLCLLWADTSKKVHLQDTWTDDKGLLWKDEQEDCKGLRYIIKQHITIFSFSREFNTCDKHDYVLEEGTTHIVWAKGEGGFDRVEGRSLWRWEKGMQRVQLLKNLKASVNGKPKDSWAFQVNNKNVKVPDLDTTYWCKIDTLPRQLEKKHHIVQFEPVIQKGNEGLVHHMELFHCETGREQEMPFYNGPCTSPTRPNSTQVCKKVLAAWAMGATPFQYPEEAGLPVGGSNYNRYVMLEVHYNNPERKSDWVDSSGLRVYFTDQLRRHDAGVIELGLEYIDKMAIPPAQTSFTLTGFCIAECTAVSLPPEGVVVFASQLHTHLTGRRVITKHVRNGRELPEMNRDNHYSTHFQEIRQLKRPIQFLPGDAFITTCWYETLDRKNITLGGFAISDEMCVNYIYYYPKTELEVCKSSISDTYLKNYFNSMKVMENQKTSGDWPISEAYGGIVWNPLRVEVLKLLFEESPIYMQCNMSSGERFPGNWEEMPTTKVIQPLPPPISTCSKRINDEEVDQGEEKEEKEEEISEGALDDDSESSPFRFFM